MGAPPIDIQDHVLVFGTKQTNPVQWHRLGEDTRIRGTLGSALYRELDQYLKPGTRAAVPVDEPIDPTTWTLSSLRMRVRDYGAAAD